MGFGRRIRGSFDSQVDGTPQERGSDVGEHHGPTVGGDAGRRLNLARGRVVVRFQQWNKMT